MATGPGFESGYRAATRTRARPASPPMSTEGTPREHRGNSVGTAWDCWALARWREPFCTCARLHLAIRTGHNCCSTPHLPLWTPLRRAQRLLHHYPNSQAWGHCLRSPLFCTFSLTRIRKALTLELSRELISRLTCTTLAITFRSRLLAHSASSRAVALPNRSHTLNRCGPY